jgi:hypothetical protein
MFSSNAGQSKSGFKAVSSASSLLQEVNKIVASNNKGKNLRIFFMIVNFNLLSNIGFHICKGQNESTSFMFHPNK